MVNMVGRQQSREMGSCEHKAQDSEHFEEQDVAGQLISIVVVHPSATWPSK